MRATANQRASQAELTLMLGRLDSRSIKLAAAEFEVALLVANTISIDGFLSA